MPVNEKTFLELTTELQPNQVALVAVSKTKPVSEIRELYHLGQLDFGENYVQELTEKQPQLPPDIRWHFIGHLQTNKARFIVPFVHLIHGVDSFKLLKEISKQASKLNREVNCLLQVHIAEEETKFGFDQAELAVAMKEISQNGVQHVHVRGLMGMASFSDDQDKIRTEFRKLKRIYDRYAGGPFNILSMGMSSDYKIAIEEGSNMVRIGTLLFGNRV
jgi:pyridoxal phosphate enzyme (YggS family)